MIDSFPSHVPAPSLNPSGVANGLSFDIKQIAVYGSRTDSLDAVYRCTRRLLIWYLQDVKKIATHIAQEYSSAS